MSIDRNVRTRVYFVLFLWKSSESSCVYLVFFLWKSGSQKSTYIMWRSTRGSRCVVGLRTGTRIVACVSEIAPRPKNSLKKSYLSCPRAALSVSYIRRNITRWPSNTQSSHKTAFCFNSSSSNHSPPNFYSEENYSPLQCCARNPCYDHWFCKFSPQTQVTDMRESFVNFGGHFRRATVCKNHASSATIALNNSQGRTPVVGLTPYTFIHKLDVT